MFFADPVAAFTNIGLALRPKGRLVMMVWREHDRNEWSVLIERALAACTDVPDASLVDPVPFSLADPTATGRILDTAGFVEASFTDVHEPVYYGHGCRCGARLDPWFRVRERRAPTAGSRLDGARPRPAASDSRRAPQRTGCVVRLSCMDCDREPPLTTPAWPRSRQTFWFDSTVGSLTPIPSEHLLSGLSRWPH